MVDGMYLNGIRGSPRISKLDYMSDMTPKLPCNIDVDIFNDCISFSKNVSSSILGVMELSKYESNPYRVRYLDSIECKELFMMHYDRIKMNYYDRVMLYDENNMKLNELDILSNDHMRSIVILSICSRCYKLWMYNDNKYSVIRNDGLIGGVDCELYNYSTKLVKIIYNSVINSSGMKNDDLVENFRYFYNFILKGIILMDYYNMDLSTMKKMVLLYLLLLNLTDSLLFNVPCININKDDEFHNIISYIICCYIEDYLRCLSLDYIDCEYNTRFVPDLSNKCIIFTKHFSVLNGILMNGGLINNKNLLSKCIKSLCTQLNGNVKGKHLVVWCMIIQCRMACGIDMLSDGRVIFKTLIDDIVKNKNVVQLYNIVDILMKFIENSTYNDYICNKLNPIRAIYIFIINGCKYIRDRMDDLAIPIFMLFNIIINISDKILSAISKILTDPHECMTIDKNNIESIIYASDILINATIHSSGQLQPIICIILHKLSVNGNLMKNIKGRKNRDNICKPYLTIMRCCMNTLTSTATLPTTLPPSTLPSTSTDYIINRDPIHVLGRLIVLESLLRIKVPELAEINTNIIELRNIVLRSSNTSLTTLCNIIINNEIPFKLLSYDIIINQVPDTTLICCIFSSIVNKNQYIPSILSHYQNNNPQNFINIDNSIYKFYSNLNNTYSNCISMLNFKLGLLSIHTIIQSIYQKSPIHKQKFITNVLKSNNSVTSVEYYQTEIQKYKNKINQLNKINNEQSYTIQQHNHTINTLNHNINTIKTNLSNLQNEHNKSNHERNTLAEQYKNIKLKYNELENEIAKLNGKIRDYDVKYQRMRQYQTDYNNLTNEMNQQTTQLENLYKMLICLANKYTNQTAILEQQKDETNKSKTHVAQLKSDINKLESNIQKKDMKLSEMSSANNAQQHEIVRLKDEINKREGDLNHLRRDVGEFQSRIEHLNRSIKKREDQYNQLVIQLKDKERELLERKQQLSAIASACNSRPL